MIKNTKKRGRPPVAVTWPDGEFTVKDVVKEVSSSPSLPSLSGVSVQLKINKAVTAGVLQVVGKIRTGNGRPKISYKRRS